MDPLASRFGERLSLCRDGYAARWSFDGQSVMVEARAGGVAASFIERPSFEHVSARRGGGVYRSADTTYQLTREGCRRMTSDMLAFFSGAREPRFLFTDVQLLEA